MTKIYIHIGTGKTGTTSIQRALAANETWLNEQGYYPLSANRTRKNSAKHRIKWQNHKVEGWADWASELAEKKPYAKAFILSNEALFRRSPKSIGNIAKAFDGFEIIPIMYVREQVEYFQSVALQLQKNKNSSFDLRDQKALEAKMGRRKLDYVETAERWERNIKSRTFHARLFSRDHFVGGDLVTDFLSSIGLDDTKSVKIPKVTSNPGLNVEFADILNRRSEDIQKFCDYAEALDLALLMSSQGVGSKYFLTQEQVEARRQVYKVENQRFASEWLKNADEIPEQVIWETAEPAFHRLDEIEATFFEYLDRAPRLLKSWKSKGRLGERLFKEGWERMGGRKGDRVVMRLDAEKAIMRFRMPFRHADKIKERERKQLEINFQVRGGATVVANVKVNDTDLGLKVLPTDPILYPVADCGPMGEVEVTLNVNPEAAKKMRVNGVTSRLV